MLQLSEPIHHKIYTLRGKQAMLDEDLAQLYQVETKVFNQAVKRNIERLPDDFRFQLTEKEYATLKSQNVTSSVEDDDPLRSQIATLEKTDEKVMGFLREGKNA